jgi:5-methyltetrahydropteroyltriglutamate--homocysteine methyltransferase
VKTEPIGSIPRPPALLQAMAGFQAGTVSKTALDEASATALRDTIERFEQTGSPVISDGEQTKPSFATYPLAGLTNLVADGVVIPFADGHTRQLPCLTAGPFRYGTHAAAFVTAARTYTKRPLKQAVISASALSLLYPGAGIPGYSREQFVADLIDEAAADIRGALDAGADSVQIDFTEGRLSLKLDPSGVLLRSFIDLNNQVLDRFSATERERINPAIETPGKVRDRILEAASVLPGAQLGSTDDCGFSPFADDLSTARDTAFSKILARVEGTALAATDLGL